MSNILSKYYFENNILYRNIKALFDLQCFKIGDYTLKSGITSPYYLDMRNIISCPSIMENFCNHIYTKFLIPITKITPTDRLHICGVPYAGIPMATVLSFKSNIPLLMIRKEPKTYGTKKLIEGLYQKGDKVILVEDVVTTGKSLLETIDKVEEEGLEILGIIALVDRQQGGVKLLKEKGYRVDCVFTIDSIIDIGYSLCLIDDKQIEYIKNFKSEQITTNPQLATIPPSNTSIPPSNTSTSPSNTSILNSDNYRIQKAYHKMVKEKIRRVLGGRDLPFPLPFTSADVSELKLHPIRNRLEAIMKEKKTNLCFAADFTKKRELLEWVNNIGPYICILKTHIDILEDFTPEVITELKRLSKQHNFLIFEDRKFGDIGKTFDRQLYGGIYKIGNWADIINIHGVSAEGMLQYLDTSCREKCGDNCRSKKGLWCRRRSIGILIVSEMSSSDNLITPEYTRQTLEIARKYPSQVLGFICQKQFAETYEDTKFLYMTPGVKIGRSGNSMKVVDQRYRNPGEAIERDGCDIMIVGSGIYSHDDPIKITLVYQRLGWKSRSD